MRALAHLHRSLVFWAGLLVVIFLAWIAVCSRQRMDGINYVLSPDRRISIYSKGTCLHLNQVKARQAERVRISFGKGGQMDRIRGSTFFGSEQTWFPALETGREFRPTGGRFATTGAGTEQLGIIIPYWLIILSTAAVWLPLSLWRARRIAIIRTALQAEPAKTPP
jgi:hypothetical protein